MSQNSMLSKNWQHTRSAGRTGESRAVALPATSGILFRMACVFLVFGFTTVSVAWADPFYVSPSGDNDNPGTLAEPWKTLTFALAAVGAGDQVHAEAGTYDTGNGEVFPLAIPSDVSLIGSGIGLSLISAPGDGPIFHQIEDLGSDTTLSGFTVRFETAATERPMVLFELDEHMMAPTIAGNEFLQPDSDRGGLPTGIEVLDTGSGRGVFHGLIEDNRFVGVSSGILFDLRNGGNDDFTSTMRRNQFDGTRYGIAVYAFGEASGLWNSLIENNVSEATLESDVYVFLEPRGELPLIVRPQISGNTFDGVGTNFEWYFEPDEPTSSAEFSPTVSDNTLDGARNLYLEGRWDAAEADVTMRPVIVDNEMSALDRNLVIQLIGAEGNQPEGGELPTMTVSPMIARNVLSDATLGVEVFFEEGGAGFESELSIEGNQIRSPGMDGGVDLRLTDFRNAEQFEVNWAVTNNTITNLGETAEAAVFVAVDTVGLEVDSGSWDFTVSGNRVAGSFLSGIHVIPASDWGDDARIDQRVAVVGNVTEGTGGSFRLAASAGLQLELSGQSALRSNEVLVADNLSEGYIFGAILGSQGHHGDEITYETNPIAVACNRFSGEGSGVAEFVADDGVADYGNGRSGSPGLNVLRGGKFYALEFESGGVPSIIAKAENNDWGATDPLTIDALIEDDEESAGGPEVDFDPFLDGPPTVVTSSNITVTPLGGDLYGYEAVISSTGQCIEPVLIFTADTPAAGSVVEGSVTTTHGHVVTEEPVEVFLGYLGSGPTTPPGTGPRGSGGTAVVTWTVSLPSGDPTEIEAATDGPIEGLVPSTLGPGVEPEDPGVLGVPTAGTGTLALLAALLAMAALFVMRRTTGA